jgi:hypothetical protein
MNVNDMIALNTTAADNTTFYGNAVASTGDIFITGPTSDILLSVNATTGPSSLRIPLGSVTSATQSILTFINNKTTVLSAYDSLLLVHNAIKTKDKSQGNFGVNLRLHATDEAEINLDIDKTSGKVLIDARTFEGRATFAAREDYSTALRDASGAMAEDLARQVMDAVLGLKW